MQDTKSPTTTKNYKKDYSKSFESTSCVEKDSPPPYEKVSQPTRAPLSPTRHRSPSLSFLPVRHHSSPPTNPRTQALSALAVMPAVLILSTELFTPAR
jgi:hypothetical protein